MTSYTWLGALVVMGSVGCSGSVTSGTDGGAGGGDATTPSDAGAMSDAKAPDGGSADAACVTGTVTFEILAAPGSTTGYCLGPPNTCSAQWLEILAAGSDASLAFEMPCVTTCAQCQPIACTDQCAVPSPLGDAGARTTWDGTYYASGTCGAGMACVDPACAPPGSYVARFCGYAETPDASPFGCTGAATPTCKDTPFTWPPAAGGAPVQGVLGGG